MFIGRDNDKRQVITTVGVQQLAVYGPLKDQSFIFGNEGANEIYVCLSVNLKNGVT